MGVDCADCVFGHQSGGCRGHCFPPDRRSASPSLHHRTRVYPDTARAFFRELDDDRRDELVGELREYRKGFRDLRKNVREKARDVASALRAEPYDEVAVTKALEVYEAEAQVMVGRGRNIAENFFKRLTPDERKLIADQIERKTMSRRRWKRWKEEREE